MTKDPKKIREIVRVCATLSKSAATPEERDAFAELADKWQKFATDAEKGKGGNPDGHGREARRRDARKIV
jgi:hypothetical protein